MATKGKTEFYCAAYLWFKLSQECLRRDRAPGLCLLPPWRRKPAGARPVTRLVVEGVDADAVQHRALLVRVAAAKVVLPLLPAVDAGQSQLGEPRTQHRDERGRSRHARSSARSSDETREGITMAAKRGRGRGGWRGAAKPRTAPKPAMRAMAAMKAMRAMKVKKAPRAKAAAAPMRAAPRARGQGAVAVAMRARTAVRGAPTPGRQCRGHCAPALSPVLERSSRNAASPLTISRSPSCSSRGRCGSASTAERLQAKLKLDQEGYDESEDLLHLFALDTGRLRLCPVGQIMASHPPVGEAARDAAQRNLLPLPCAFVSAEETLVHEQVAEGKSPKALRRSAGPPLRRVGKARHLANVLHARASVTGTSSAFDPPFCQVFESLCRAAAAKVQDFNAQEVASTLWAIAKTSRVLPEFLDTQY